MHWEMGNGHYNPHQVRRLKGNVNLGPLHILSRGEFQKTAASI